MKTMCLIIIFSCTVACLSAQNRITINGSIANVSEGTRLTLIKLQPRRFKKQEKLDLVVANGSFTANVETDGGELFNLTLGRKSRRFDAAPGKINLSIPDSNLRSIVITGNQAALQYDSLETLVDNNVITSQYNKARVAYALYVQKINNQKIPYQNNDTLRILSLAQDSLQTLYNENVVKQTVAFSKQYPSSYLSVYLLYNAIQKMPDQNIRGLHGGLKPSVTKGTWGRELRYRLDSLMEGGKAPNFAEADTAGNLMSLSNFRGRYILLDFWASWCVPCREENPNLLKLKQQFTGKKFEIVSVSLDRDKKPWLDAISKDRLNWIHLSNLQGWDNKVSIKYYVYSIPANFLISPDGTILARDVRGEELIKILKEKIK